MFHPCSSVSIVNFEHVLAGWLNWKQQNLRLLTIENINLSLPKQKYIFSIYCLREKAPSNKSPAALTRGMNMDIWTVTLPNQLFT